MNLRSFLAVSCVLFGFASSAMAECRPTTAGECVYKIQEKGLNLSLISLELYGKVSRWHKIAEWNNIAAPYRVHVGQKLHIKDAPTLTKAEADRAILNYWRKKMGLTGEPAVAKAAVTASGPAQINLAPEQETQLTQAKEYFHRKSFKSAFMSIQAAVNEYKQTKRSPASVDSIAGANPSVIQAVTEELREGLDQKNLAWYEGPTAELVYRTMTQVKETKTKYDSQSCSQKKGENVICLRCPASTPEEHEKTMCAGFFD